MQDKDFKESIEQVRDDSTQVYFNDILYKLSRIVERIVFTNGIAMQDSSLQDDITKLRKEIKNKLPQI